MTFTDEELAEWTAPEWVDRTLPMDGTAKTIRPKDVLMAGARMQRDGRSLRYIKRELQLNMLGSEFITDRQLQNALNLGHKLLAQAIKRGEEPEESKVLVLDEDVAMRLSLPGRDFDPGKVQ
jgi:hypothetical protein